MNPTQNPMDTPVETAVEKDGKEEFPLGNGLAASVTEADGSEHFELAIEFFNGLGHAKKFGLEYEYVQWFLDDLISCAQTPSPKGSLPKDRMELVREAVSYGLGEWDM
jgi:hypothetical protein